MTSQSRLARAGVLAFLFCCIIQLDGCGGTDKLGMQPRYSIGLIPFMQFEAVNLWGVLPALYPDGLRLLYFSPDVLLQDFALGALVGLALTTVRIGTSALVAFGVAVTAMLPALVVPLPYGVLFTPLATGSPEAPLAVPSRILFWSVAVLAYTTARRRSSGSPAD